MWDKCGVKQNGIRSLAMVRHSEYMFLPQSPRASLTAVRQTEIPCLLAWKRRWTLFRKHYNVTRLRNGLEPGELNEAKLNCDQRGSR